MEALDRRRNSLQRQRAVISRGVRLTAFLLLLIHGAAAIGAQSIGALPQAPTPTDVKPNGINCEECPYPYPSKYLDISVYRQDVRIAYMDIAPTGEANGHAVVLLHGNNFGGFYFTSIIGALTKEGFRVIVPDQIGYGKSSKPIAPYNFNSQARNTSLILQREKIERAMVVGKPPTIRPEDLPFQLNERNSLPKSGSLAAMEKSHIASVLEKNNWNISRSADILEIDRVTLYNKINKYGLRKA